MQLLRAGALAFGLAVAADAAIADRLVVVELYTSQGCSSCPPADALLGELAQRDDVLPLALHVDYWDYIGWKDSFADPAHADRQRGYARAAGARSIYTPQMIVGGTDHVVGYKPMKLAMLIDKHGDTTAPVEARAGRTGDRIDVALEARAPGVGDVVVFAVRYDLARSVDIRRGENAGRNLTYHNVVADLSEIGRWNGVGRFQASVPAAEEGLYAVFVQREGHGAILGAVRVTE